MNQEKRAYKERLQEELLRAVKEGLLNGETAEISRIRKNNGVLCHAAVIKREGAGEAPAVYIDSLLEEIEAGRLTLLEAAQEVLGKYREAEPSELLQQIRSFTREDILEKTEYKVINYEKNLEMIEELPHRRLFDLAAIYHLTAKCGYGMGSMVINRQIMERYSLCEEDLEKAAERNRRRKGVYVKDIASIIEELTGRKLAAQGISVPMWLISTPDRAYGAAVLLDEGCFEGIAEEAGGNLYILPSSIHEVLAVPEEGAGPEELRRIVGEVNAAEVSEQDFLSGNVYRYNQREHRLEMA